MNIFILDTLPANAAKYHCDKHLGKMILEGAQMLSTAVAVLRPELYEEARATGRLYATTHQNHPCSIWVRQSFTNVTWLYDLCFWLNQTRLCQGKRSHKSFEVVTCAFELLHLCPFPKTGLTQFAQVMPDEFRLDSNPVTAYRRYYTSKAKQFPLEYKDRGFPEWLRKELERQNGLA